MNPPLLTLGRYEILGRIGSGGMAEIFLARAKDETDAGELAVVKRILPARAADPSFVRMFLDEARLASALEHPNICRAYEFGVQNGQYFLTLEYIHGENLQTLMAGARANGVTMSVACAVQIITATASALHYAHELKDASGRPLDVVHRDVSPSNVMLGYDGSVKLLDFGIAKAAQRITATTAGTVKGKLNYLSPEQCRSRPVDRRTDIFSLGILLYELTTGTVLFEGDDEVAIFNRIATEDVAPPSTIVADYPRELEQIVLRALARRKEERFATAQEMRDALVAFAERERITLSNASVVEFLSRVCGDRMTRRPTDIVLEAAKPTEQITTVVQDVLYVVRDGRLETVVERTQAPARQRRWKPMVLAALGVIGVGIGFVAWPRAAEVDRAMARTRHAIASDAPIAPPAVSSSPAAAEVPIDASSPAGKRVKIQFELDPPNAILRHEDRILSERVLDLPLSHERHVVEVEAPGFISKRAEFVADENRTIAVSLARVPAPAARGDRARGSKKPPRPARAKKPPSIDRLIDRSWE